MVKHSSPNFISEKQIFSVETGHAFLYKLHVYNLLKILLTPKNSNLVARFTSSPPRGEFIKSAGVNNNFFVYPLTTIFFVCYSLIYMGVKERRTKILLSFFYRQTAILLKASKSMPTLKRYSHHPPNLKTQTTFPHLLKKALSRKYLRMKSMY